MPQPAEPAAEVLRQPDSPARVTPRLTRADWAILFALVAGSLALYARTIGFDFVNYDDDQYVFENLRVLDGLTWPGIAWAFTTGEAANWHPLTWLSLMLDVSLFGETPAGHHVTNVVLHAANAGLLFFALLRLTGLRWPAAACAAVFAVHPLRVESVAWIAERKDVLCGLFWMLTLLAYEAYARRPTRRRYLAVLAGVVLALLSKPMAVTLPFVLLLLDAWPLRRVGAWSARGMWPLVREKLPMFGLVAAASVVTFLVQRAGQAVASVTRVGLDDRLGNAAIATVEYIRQTLWPEKLAPFYPHPLSLPGGQIDWLLAGTAIAGLLAVSVIAVASWRRAPWVAVGWFWYLGTLVPVVGIVQVGEQSHADRYTYLTVIGLTIAVAYTIAAVAAGRPGLRAGVGAVFVLWLGVLVVLSHRQIGVWRDSVTLWTHGTSVVANSFVGHNNLGEALMRLPDRDADAAAQFRRVLEIRPDDALGLSNSGVAMIRAGELAKARQYLRRAVQRDPTHTPSFIHLGNLYAREGRLDDALLVYREGLKRNPNFGNGHYNVAVTLAQMGDLPGAIGHFERALAIRGDDVEARRGLGVALLMTGRTKEGVASLREALEVRPDDPETQDRLAWVLATLPGSGPREIDEAVRMAERVRETASAAVPARPDDPRLPGLGGPAGLGGTSAAGRDAARLDTLAAALARAGRFEEAVTVAADAQSRARAAGLEPLAAAIASRIDLYRAGRPFMQSARAEPAATSPSR